MSSLGDDFEGGSDSDSRIGGSSRAEWVGLAVVSLALPAVVVLVLGLGLIVVFGDPAVTLGISENFLNVLLIGLTGLVSGLAVGLISQRRGAAVLFPGAAGLVVGLVIYAVFLVLSADQTDFSSIQLVVWFGMSAAIFVTTQTSGYVMVGSIALVGLVGVGATAFLQSQP